MTGELDRLLIGADYSIDDVIRSPHLHRQNELGSNGYVNIEGRPNLIIDGPKERYWLLENQGKYIVNLVQSHKTREGL